jgi:hypothetical protein
MSQFHQDNTRVMRTDGTITSAENWINEFYSTWSFSNVHVRDVAVLFGWIIALRLATYLSLAYIRHESR